MRTKTLLLSAAALVAGVFASQAQSNVYSANVVGYVNSTVTSSYNLVATPLDNNGSNDLNSLLGSLPNKSTVQTWNGTGFTIANKSGSPSVWSPDTVVPPGTGFFIKLGSGSITNPFVGQVLVNNGGSVTNNLPASYTLVGSPIPYADDLNDTNNYLGLLNMPNKSTIQVWNGTGYTIINKSGSPSTWSPDQTIQPGQGFFIKVSSPSSWVQSLNLQ